MQSFAAVGIVEVARDTRLSALRAALGPYDATPTIPSSFTHARKHHCYFPFQSQNTANDCIPVGKFENKHAAIHIELETVERWSHDKN
jgi:hypothetical protein